MAKRALIVLGGWEGHQPREVGGVFHRVLLEEGFEVEVSDTLAAFDDGEKLKELNLIVPCWTMGKVAEAQCQAVCGAVRSGVGIAGVHGGMCDAFRESTEWQFMTGGQWVAHPGDDGTKYMVNIREPSHLIVQGIEDFEVVSEQYYMHVDPVVKVLATTRFPVADGPHASNGAVDMPVVWIKRYGQGRVFYTSLGHGADIVEMAPVRTMIRRGFLWAAK